MREELKGLSNIRRVGESAPREVKRGLGQTAQPPSKRVTPVAPREGAIVPVSHRQAIMTGRIGKRKGFCSLPARFGYLIVVLRK